MKIWSVVQTKFRTGHSVNALRAQVSVYCLTNRPWPSVQFLSFGILSHIITITCHHYYNSELIY